MTEAASRELRNNTRGLLDRVEAGEAITITTDGRPGPSFNRSAGGHVGGPREELVRRFVRHQADAGLAAELAELMPGTTDELPLR